jgi:hypothetical protein
LFPAVLSNDVVLAEIHSSSVTRGLANASGVGLNWDEGGGGGGAQFAMIEQSSWRSLLPLTLQAAARVMIRILRHDGQEFRSRDDAGTTKN